MGERLSQSQVKLLAANEQRVFDVAADDVPVKQVAENVLNMCHASQRRTSLWG
jgi:hypothetical protein